MTAGAGWALFGAARVVGKLAVRGEAGDPR